MDNPSIDVINSNRLLGSEYKFIFILVTVFIAFCLAIFVFIMVYCCRKRQSTLKNSNDLNHTQQKSYHEICIIPINKPITNESKPQLSINCGNSNGMVVNESTSQIIKPKHKTLIERRGSNNSLSLTIDLINKKKLTIASPVVESPANNENSSTTSNLLDINELIRISKQSNFLYNEFCNIPTNLPEANQVPGSAIKNRHKTILPIESTRVKLLPYRNEDPLSSYINANYINFDCVNEHSQQDKCSFIGTQGPMSNTINDFWHMVWQECVSYVVMITRLKENSKVQCDSYLPDDCSGTTFANYGDISVCVVSVKYEQDYEIREIIMKCNNQTRTVNHYWYTTWPDQSTPSNPEALVHLIKEIETSKNNSFDIVKAKSPILVHCSAGIGRTGCFIAIALGIRQIDTQNMVDVLKNVNLIRLQRGGLIQTIEQYEFVYQALAHYCMYYKNYLQSPKLSSVPKCTEKFTFNY